MRTYLSALVVSAGLILQTIPVRRESAPACCAVLAGRGNLYRVVAPEGRGARRYRFRAAVRVEGAGTTARLWVRSVSGVQQSADITAGEWGYYQIDTEIPAGGGEVAAGFVVSGPGKAWIEGASFAEVKEGKAARRREARVWQT